MTDFYSVLQRAVASLPEPTGPQRRAVYDKARKALLKQLQGFDPPLPSSDVTAQRLALEDAIRKLEADIVRNARTRRAVASALPKAAAEPAEAAPPAAEPAPRPPRPAAPPPAEGAPPASRGEVASFRREAKPAADAAEPPPRPPREAPSERPQPPRRRPEPAPSEEEPHADALDGDGTDADEPYGEPYEEIEPPRAARARPVRHHDEEAEEDEEGEGEPAPAERGRRRFALFSRSRAGKGREEAEAQRPGRRERRRRRRSEGDGRERVPPAVAVPPPLPGREASDVPRRHEAAEDFEDEEAFEEADHDRRPPGPAALVPAGPRRNALGEVDEGYDDEDGDEDEAYGGLAGPVAADRLGRDRHAQNRNRRIARVILTAAVLFIVAGAGYAAWLQRDAIMEMVAGLTGGEDGRTEPVAVGEGQPPGMPKNDDRLGGPAPAPDEEVRRVRTTRIVAPSENGGTDGTAVRDVTPPPDDGTAGADAPAEAGAETGAAPAPEETVRTAAEAEVDAVREATPDAPGDSGGQSAVLYEESPQIGEQGAALPGTVTWEVARQSIGGGDPEPVIRAVADIPERDMTATVMIRENRDGALPASHLIEVSFEVPDGFAGEGIANVPGLIMKETEQARGNALRGAAARVSSDLFWIALSNSEQEREVNLELLRDRDWIDIPILYENGRRAILTLRKGESGSEAVEGALAAWQSG